MECKKCGKSIDYLELYCEECKEILKREKELSSLIEKNKRLNKLEITKEVETLNNFKDINNEDSSNIKDDLKNIVNFNDDELKLENDKTSIIVIIISIIISLSIIGIAIYLIFFTEKEEIETPIEDTINYKLIINEYGDSVKQSLSNYIKDNDIPSWSTLSALINYDKYEVVCLVHNIYKDGSIYLDKCTVEGKAINYSYGEEKVDMEGKTLNIYIDSDSYNNLEIGTFIGSVSCKTEDCVYINAYNNYVLVEEDNKYYIYNYKNNSMEFGPFDLINEDYSNNLLLYENTLYGVLYNENGIQNIYSFINDKKLKNINGVLLESNINFDTSLMYKYGYAIFNYNNKNNFVNLKTGNVSYAIDNDIKSLVENSSKNLVYIITNDINDSKIVMYNSNGKKLFDGKKFTNFRLVNENIILSSDNNFYIYDYDLKIKLTSKNYNNVLGLYDDFIVVIDMGYLEIVDLNDNVLATFELEWDDAMYKFDSILSGKAKENNEDIIYLIIERSNSSLKYYYNTVTKEFGLK